MLLFTTVTGACFLARSFVRKKNRHARARGSAKLFHHQPPHHAQNTITMTTLFPLLPRQNLGVYRGQRIDLDRKLTAHRAIGRDLSRSS